MPRWHTSREIRCLSIWFGSKSWCSIPHDIKHSREQQQERNLRCRAGNWFQPSEIQQCRQKKEKQLEVLFMHVEHTGSKCVESLQPSQGLSRCGEPVSRGGQTRPRGRGWPRFRTENSRRRWSGLFSRKPAGLAKVLYKYTPLAREFCIDMWPRRRFICGRFRSKKFRAAGSE